MEREYIVRKLIAKRLRHISQLVRQSARRDVLTKRSYACFPSSDVEARHFSPSSGSARRPRHGELQPCSHHVRHALTVQHFPCFGHINHAYQALSILPSLLVFKA